MSKRNRSVRSTTTLLDYFTKITPNKVKPDEDGGPAPESAINGAPAAAETRKREREAAHIAHSDDSNDEATIVPTRRKKIRIHPLDSDSDTENKGGLIQEPGSSRKSGVNLKDSFQYEPILSRNSPSSLDKTMNRKTILASGSTMVQSKSSEPHEKELADGDGDWMHCKLEWLKPENIMDRQKRKCDDLDYDPSTLYVPLQFLNSRTPAHRQWWEMKSLHYDCVLFFKVGKFYELYHMDASVGVTELGFNYMKGDFAHSGFPEVAYGRMATTLISKGYKVARVEQTETPEMMEERCKKMGRRSTKFDKVVLREICAVTMRGTQVYDLQESGPCEASAIYMMAVTEEAHKDQRLYGVCYVDTSIGQFHMGQFYDDKHSSRLLTTLAHYPPAYIVYDRRTVTPCTKQLLSGHCHSARREPLAMWTPEKTLTTLAEKYYKTSDDSDWPEGLKQFLHEGDALGLTPAAGCSLAVRALGGCVAALTNCLLDIQVLGMSQFARYTPPDVLNDTLSQVEEVEDTWAGGRTMVLDFITLRNLRILNDEGCLYDRLNSCVTPMGKRLLHQWVCAPSCSLTAIKERQAAVEVLLGDLELCRSTRAILATLPDFERVLAKLHALGNTMRSKQHPDARAIFYEAKIYSKRNVSDFMSMLKGFTDALTLGQLFTSTDSVLLRRLTQIPPDGKFPDYRSTLQFFQDGFNQKEARDEGRILPKEGVDEVYDAALCELEEIQADADEYLNQQERYFRCKLKYVGAGKKRFQLEIPNKAVQKIGPEYSLEGRTGKTTMRYTTKETKDILARLIAAEERKANSLNDVNRRVFHKFTAHCADWEAAVQCCAALDVLVALADFARMQTDSICLPEITDNNHQKPYISISDGRHPCISVVDNYIPNDTTLGADKATLMLLTGPNMGGKSTLMRQVGLLTVLAHLGSYVPAGKCSLSLVDRIFTRLGASDDIHTGQSTFLVEMNETGIILKHASQHSLVLMDELGRGTSAYDGAAIAGAVCRNLAERGCRTIFSTHYHSLIGDFGHHSCVMLGHMACMVETEPNEDEEIPEETITFLYKLSPGACPKSYGFNAARLAGIPRDLVHRARAIASRLEAETSRVYLLKEIFNRELQAASLKEKILAENF